MFDSVAVCLFGISYLEKYSHWGVGETSIDYTRSLDNYQEHIFSKLSNYDIYVSTYNHRNINSLRRHLKVKRGISHKDPIISGVGISSFKQRNRMISAFENLLDDTYEWYLFTRFDLHFNFDIDKLPYDKDKVNVLAVLELPHLICDNFYMVHRSQLEFFFRQMRRSDITSLNRHDVGFFEGFSHVHVLTSERGKAVRHLKCYKIIRS